MRRILRTICLIAITFILGCTAHPPGEKEERQSAIEAGTSFPTADPPPLSNAPTQDELVERALLSNQEVQQKYWEWRAAIEQIPQDGTQPGNVALFAGLGMTNGSIGRDSANLGIGNDPMNDILLPPKLSAAATRALQNAKAAGKRFRKAQLELRAKVISAYTEYALANELIRIEESNRQLIETTLSVTQARIRAGRGSQQEALRTSNELDLSKNDIATLRSNLFGQLATLNALLDRNPDALIKPPQSLPELQQIKMTDGEILSLAKSNNPELAAISDEALAAKTSIALAKLQYLPDFSLSVNSDLAGITQSLAGMVTLPLFRHEAIEAAVLQAEANLKAKEAMRRQNSNDLIAAIVSDLNTVRDASRQLALLDGTVIPRARQIVNLVRTSYENGQSTLIDLLDAQRSLNSLSRMRAQLIATAEKRTAMMQTVVGKVPLRK